MICQSNSQLKVFPSVWTMGIFGSAEVAAALRHELLVPSVVLGAGDSQSLGQIWQNSRFPLLPGNRNVQIPLYDSFVVPGDFPLS